MKILVCGGRNYADKERVFSVLDILDRDEGVTAVVHGAASGADSLAGEWARARNKPEHKHPAEWSRHGRAAGPIRNTQMLDEHPDIKVVVAFTGGAGTDNMVYQAKRRGILIMVGR